MQTTVHQFLKESTRSRHESAEVHPFQVALAQGQLPLSSYKRYMRQLENLHLGFEQKLKEAAQNDPLVAAVVNEQLYQLPFLQADVAALGAAPEAPLPCIERFLDMPVFKHTPASLLGTLYVLLGAKHGGKFIAHKTKEVYALDEAGYTYFNPYGDRFRSLWQDFTGGLNNLPHDQELLDGLLEASNATFDIFVEIGDGVWRSEAAGIGTH